MTELRKESDWWRGYTPPQATNRKTDEHKLSCVLRQAMSEVTGLVLAHG
jgi:hypothetical protein